MQILLSCVWRWEKTSWWHRSMYLPTAQIHYLNMTDEDRVTLKNLIDRRLRAQALAMTKLCLNINRNESLNRSLPPTLPKNVNLSCAVTDRACAATDWLKSGAGASILRKLESNKTPISKGSHVARTTWQIQREALYHRTYMRRRSVRMRLLSNKRKRFDAVQTPKRVYCKWRRETLDGTARQTNKKKKKQLLSS